MISRSSIAERTRTLGRSLASARRPAAALVAAALLLPIALLAQRDVLTNRYDPARTGTNLAETTLTPAIVNVRQFGKLDTYPVDGAVYAQPLYAAGVAVNGTARNVLYVATMNDKVYAFDADKASASPLWMRDFTSPPSVTAVPITDIAPPNLNIVGNVGIQGTPVIDRAAGTIYLVARTKENGSYVQRLHALDIATGAARPRSPVTIAGTFPGTAPDSTAGASGRVITFDPKAHIQRAGLAITNGVVLIAWAAHEDINPSHGWIMAYDASTLARVGIFAVTPDVYGGGIWQGGRAPTIDAAGRAYFATGNGPWDGTRNFGDSLLKFDVSLTTGLTLLDYFTPGNEATLNTVDDDLSGSGFTLLPGTSLLLGGGKEGVLYLIDSTNLGHKVANDTQIVQRINVNGGHVMAGANFWNSAAQGPLVYNWSEDDALKAYRLSGGKLSTTLQAQGSVISPGHPGGSLTVSANGSTAGSGIVWASIPTYQDAIHGLTAGTLRAFDGETLDEIWTSDDNASRDQVGTLVKFVPPVVVNGRVFLANHDGGVNVYGLLPADFTIGVSPGGAVIAPGAQGVFSVTVGALGAFAGNVTLSATGQPAGTTVSFSPAAVTGSGTATMTVAVPGTAESGSFQLVVTGTSDAAARSAGPTAVTVSRSSTELGAIGIDFVGTATPMGGDERAGVIAQTHWNNAEGAARTTPLALVDDLGQATGATVTWAAGAAWATPIADQTGDPRMMKGYLDTTSTTTTTLTVAGLTDRSYDVYVYADGDNRSYARSAAYTISGPGIVTRTVTLTDAASANFAGAFLQAEGTAGNYVKFTIDAGAFKLTATPGTAATATRRAPVNAVQIVPAGAAATPPAPVGINFVGSTTLPMGAAERAGVVVASSWNNAAGGSRSTPLALVDGNGAGSGATVTWSASGVWMTPVADQPGNARMMKGYLDTSSTSTTSVTVAGLARRAYDVYVYVDGDNRSYARTGSYTISDAGVTTTTIDVTDAAGAGFSTTFVEANGSSGNYLKFSIQAGGFTLTAKPGAAATATRRAPINALQIVPVAPPATPPAISLDFAGSLTTVMSAAETAGVVPRANWNHGSGAASGAPLALVGDTGAATGATAAWQAGGVWMTPIADQPGDGRMMKGYLDTSTSSTVTVAGLAPARYDVYVYADGDNRSYGRTAAYTISGPGIPATTVTITDPPGTNFSAAFVRGDASSGNYVRFSIDGGGFTLTAAPVSGSNGTLRAPINGIQIVPAAAASTP